MRGKVHTGSWDSAVKGITPAYAGKRTSPLHEPSMRRDHPRVCGEKTKMLSSLDSVSRSPPRMRGKDQACSRWRYPDGITPAYAGKRIIAERAAIFSRDHPRVCGEKTPVQVMVEQPKGSPPHVRGKGIQKGTCNGSPRITPAYAGKSFFCKVSAATWQDHPRVCGEKNEVAFWSFVCVGSPPRMRGKDSPELVVRYAHRITPAYAGKSARKESA